MQKKGSGSFLRVGSGPAAWSEFHGDDEPDPISLSQLGIDYPEEHAKDARGNIVLAALRVEPQGGGLI